MEVFPWITTDLFSINANARFRLFEELGPVRGGLAGLKPVYEEYGWRGLGGFVHGSHEIRRDPVIQRGFENEIGDRRLGSRASRPSRQVARRSIRTIAAG